MGSQKKKLFRKILRMGEYHPIHNKAKRHFVKMIDSAFVEKEPFDNIRIKNAFPEKYYKKILDLFPEPEGMVPYNYPGSTQPDGSISRYMLMLNDCNAHKEGYGMHGSVDHISGKAKFFWTGVMNVLNSKEVYDALMEKFRPVIEEKYNQKIEELDLNQETSLTLDTEGYMIPPHPDSKTKVLSTILFIANDESLSHLSTEYYKEDLKGKVKNPQGKTFVKVDEVGYVPNVFQAFVPTHYSWHGVSKINDKNVKRKAIHLLVSEKEL